MEFFVQRCVFACGVFFYRCIYHNKKYSFTCFKDGYQSYDDIDLYKLGLIIFFTFLFYIFLCANLCCKFRGEMCMTYEF
jgi:hypothetical protein